MFESLLIEAPKKTEIEGTSPNYKESIALRLILFGTVAVFTLKL